MTELRCPQCNARLLKAYHRMPGGVCTDCYEDIRKGGPSEYISDGQKSEGFSKEPVADRGVLE